MKNGTNLFFLAVAAGVAWWAWNEYQTQKAAQEKLFAEKALQGYDDFPIDYAEQIAQGYIY